MGKKIRMIMLMTLLSAPLIAVGADNKEPVNDQPAVSANQQQDVNDSDDVTPAATPKAVEPASATAAAATTVSESPIPLQHKSAEESGLTEKKLEMFSQKIISLSDEIIQLKQQADQFRQQISQLQYTVYGLAVLVVLLALLSMARRPKKTPKNKTAAPPKQTPDSGKTIKIEDDTAGEYDFMGSSEGIPAKLDLARAYIAMEDYTAARETLAEILGEGSEEHCQEARSLLKKINQ